MIHFTYTFYVKQSNYKRKFKIWKWYVTKLFDFFLLHW